MASQEDYNEILRHLDSFLSEPTYSDNPQEQIRKLFTIPMNFEPPVMMAGFPEGARTIYVTPASRDEETEINVPNGFERAARYASPYTPIKFTYATKGASLPPPGIATTRDEILARVNPIFGTPPPITLDIPQEIADKLTPPTPMDFEPPSMMAGSPAGAKRVYTSPFYYDKTPLDYAETAMNQITGGAMNISRAAERGLGYALSPVVAGITYATTDASLPESWNATMETIPELVPWADMSGYTNPVMNPDGSPNLGYGIEALTGFLPIGNGLKTVGKWATKPFTMMPGSKPGNVNLERFVDNIADDVAFRGDTSGIVPWSLRGTEPYKVQRVVEPPSWTGRPAIMGDVTDETLTKLALEATPKVDPLSNIPNNIRLLTDTDTGTSLSDLVKLGLGVSGAGAAGYYTGEKIDEAIANANEAEARREQAQRDGANIAEILDSKNADSASSQPSRFSPTAQTGGSPQSPSFLSQAGQSLNPSQLSSLGLPQTSLSGYTPYTLDFELAINNPYSPLYGLQPNADNNLMPAEEALNYDPKIDEWYTNLKAKLSTIPREELIGLETPVNLKPFIDEAGKGFGISELKSDKETETINRIASDDLNGIFNWLKTIVDTPTLNRVQERIKAYEEGLDSALNTINSTTRLLTSAENEAADNYSDSFWSWLALILTVPFSIRRGISPMETWDKIITSRVNLNNRVRELRSARDAQIESLNTARTAFTDYARLAPSLIEAESRQTPNLNTVANALNGLANWYRAQYEQNSPLTALDQAKINELNARTNWWANRPYPSETSDNAYDKAMSTLYPILLLNPNALPLETRRQVEDWANNLYPTGTNPSIFYNQNANPTYQKLDNQQPR